MALDEAILWAVAEGLAPPTLRLYAWEPPCLSLGRAQPLADVDVGALCAAGFDIVRRPTGGKAILHADELTYSVVAPATEPRVAGSVLDCYRRLGAGLMRGLERLGLGGLAVEREEAARGGSTSPVCFERSSGYEITCGGRKLLGSAQMRARGAVLQHGALPLRGDIGRICLFLSTSSDPASVRARAVTLEEALWAFGESRGQPVAWEEAANALVEGFAEALEVRLRAGALTAQEQAWAEELRVTKYASPEWTYRV